MELPEMTFAQRPRLIKIKKLQMALVNKLYSHPLSTLQPMA